MRTIAGIKEGTAAVLELTEADIEFGFRNTVEMLKTYHRHAIKLDVLKEQREALPSILRQLATSLEASHKPS